MINKFNYREKLIKLGAKNLSDFELLSILLRTGVKGNDVKSLSLEVLSKINRISHIKNLKIEDLVTINGISISKATTIISAVELGRRIYIQKEKNKKRITNTNDVYKMIKDDMVDLDREHMIVISVNIKGEILKKEVLYIGTSTSIQVSVKDVFKSAILVSAFGIIIAHNHPSGDFKPSIADDEITKKIAEVGIVIGIKLIEHLIIGKQGYYSYKKHEKINF